VERKSSAPLVLLMAVVLVTAGCLTADDDGDNGGNGPPPVGTTEGFTFPEFEYREHTAIDRTTERWRGHYDIIHVVDSTEEFFEPQVAQLRAVRHHYDNISVQILTLMIGNETPINLDEIQVLYDIEWTLGTPKTDVVGKLSIIKPLTVFLLDPDRVILLRSDDMLGQARIIQAIEATWGVEPSGDAFPQVGSPVPELVWRDIDGVEGSLSSLEGGPVLLNVWEMECPFCMELFVELGKVHGNYSGEGLRMISIDLVTWETEAQVRGVMEEHNATWTFAIDGDNIQSRYDIWRLPLLVLLDAEGVVQWVWTGYTHSSVIDVEVEKLI
jgi:thiol-disulfide isomerase/thioredoxin